MFFILFPSIRPFLSLISNFLSDNPDVTNCHERNGTSVLKVHVMLDELAILSITAGSGSLKGIFEFFGKIFDELNEDLMPYGVQFHGNFSQLITTFPYDKIKCVEGNPAMVRSIIASNALTLLNPMGYGLRLIVFFCPNMMVPTMTGKANLGCNAVAGFLFGNLGILRKMIKKELVKVAFGTENDGSKDFNDSVCSKVKFCLSNWDTTLGRYIGDLKAVRHISDGKYILKDGDKLNEHDLYDDVYLMKYKSRHED